MKANGKWSDCWWQTGLVASRNVWLHSYPISPRKNIIKLDLCCLTFMFWVWCCCSMFKKMATYSRAYWGQTPKLLSVITKRVSMYYCRYRLTSWHMVISYWEGKDSVQLSNCQRYDQEHNRVEISKKRYPPSRNEWILDVQEKYEIVFCFF